MGFNMANENLSPENFSSAIQDIVLPFVQRKRATLLNQMGVYGQPGMQPGPLSSTTGGPQSQGILIKYNGKTYTFPSKLKADQFKEEMGIK
jgi:hypothetical protein